MRDINEIIGKMKVAVSARDKKDIYILLDKDIAKEMKITSNNLSIHKKRGTVPYVKIMDWCYKNNISMKEIFYGDKK